VESKERAKNNRETYKRENKQIMRNKEGTRPVLNRFHDCHTKIFSCPIKYKVNNKNGSRPSDLRNV
jgi:hypothetical protein